MLIFAGFWITVGSISAYMDCRFKSYKLDHVNRN